MPLTDDLSDGFFRQVQVMATSLGCDPEDALKVWFSESIGIYADAKNPAGAYGINQMTGDSLRGVGWKGTPDEYLALTAEEQLPYVEKYYNAYKGKLTSAARLYQVNFLPATLNTVTTPNGVLAAKDGVYSNFHAQNPALDVGKKGYITLDDLRKVVEAATTNTFKLRKGGGGSYADRWKEIVSRLRSTAAAFTPAMLIGGWWDVTTEEGAWRYQFWPDGGVVWTTADNSTIRGTGRWVAEGGRVKMTWSMSEEYWNLPINPRDQKGEVRRAADNTFPVTAARSAPN